MAVALPPIIGKRYQVLSELGRGGMGVVYRARHTFTGELLALKVLNDELVRRDRESAFRRDASSKRSAPAALPGPQKESLGASWAMRFQREMQISARIASEHVVRITDADVAPELDGALFYVMELLRGADLDHLLQERGTFSAEETVWIFGQLAEGLDRAHQAGIVHRGRLLPSRGAWPFSAAVSGPRKVRKMKRVSGTLDRGAAAH